MPSSPSTVAKAKRVRELYKQMGSAEAVADKVEDCSPALVREYLERNAHAESCPSCGGFGISKKRSTGEKRPLCQYE